MSMEREEKRCAEKDRLLPLHPLITLVPAIAIPHIYSVPRSSTNMHLLLSIGPDVIVVIGYLFSF